MNLELTPIKTNFNELQLGEITIWFSYSTPIAFKKYGKLVIRKNDWSTTTGKHLNLINTDKSIRIDGAEFEKRLEDELTNNNK